MLAPYNTNIVTFVKAFAVQVGVVLGALVCTALPRGKHPWPDLFSPETPPEPVLLAIDTGGPPVAGWDDPFHCEATLEVFTPIWPGTVAMYLQTGVTWPRAPGVPSGYTGYWDYVADVPQSGVCVVDTVCTLA